MTTGPLNLSVDPVFFVLFCFVLVFFAAEGNYQQNAGMVVPHLLYKPPLGLRGRPSEPKRPICNCDSLPQVQQLRVGLREFNG